MNPNEITFAVALKEEDVQHLTEIAKAARALADAITAFVKKDVVVSVRDETNTMRAWLVEKRGERTQAQVAAASGISQNFYSCIENGDRRPSVETAKRVADCLGFDWTLFFTEDEPRPRPKQAG